MTQEQASILLVEDDPKLSALVRDYLSAQGYRVSVEGRGDRAPERILSEQPDLVILDLMLPGLDGLEVCRRVRESFGNPILMLTARSDEIDEVLGLEMGADDYMAKPVRPRLLLARVHSLLRRVERNHENGGELTVSGLEIEALRREVRYRGELLDLTTAEFDLLEYLAKRAGTVVERDLLYRELRGIEWDGFDRSIDLRIARLRKKLGDDARSPKLIKSVRGVGYLLVPELD